MAEYIEREALLKRLDMASDCKNCPRCVDMKTYYDRCAYTDIQDVCSVISEMPAVDIEKLIQARLRGIQKTKLDALQSSDHKIAYMMLGAEKVCNEILEDVSVIIGNKI